jgi:hypothetical protein
MAESYLVLWWVPAGYTPTVAEAIGRLELLRRHGPSPQAFTFRSLFPPPEVGEAEVPGPAPARPLP